MGGVARGLRARLGHADESGLTISLWVVMIVPVVAFAAMAAGAVSERLAAEAALRDAADGVADVALAVERVVHAEPVFKSSWGLPTVAACASNKGNKDELKNELMEVLKPQIDYRKDKETERDEVGGEHTALNDFLEHDPPLELPEDWVTEYTDATKTAAEQRTDLETKRDELETERDELTAEINKLPKEEDVEFALELCTESMNSIYRRLGPVGIDSATLRGYHTNAAPLGYREPDIGADAGSAWLLCGPSGDAAPHGVYAVLAGQWNSSSWAAAQVWPEGVTLSAEGLRLSHGDDDSEAGPQAPLADCEPARDYIAAKNVRRHPIEIGALPDPPVPTTDPPTP